MKLIKLTANLAPLGAGVRFKSLLLFLFRMPSSGQFLESGGRGPTPQYRERTSKKLNTIRGLMWFASYQMGFKKGS